MSRTQILGLDIGGQLVVFGSALLSAFFIPFQPLVIWLLFVLVSWQVGNQINYLFYFWSRLQLMRAFWGAFVFLLCVIILLLRGDSGWVLYVEIAFVLVSGTFALFHTVQSIREFLYWSRKPKSFWDLI